MLLSLAGAPGPQAHIRALELRDAELTKRMADLQEALAGAQHQCMVAEGTVHDMHDQVAEVRPAAWLGRGWGTGRRCGRQPCTLAHPVAG